MFKVLHWLRCNIALRNHDSPYFIAKLALLFLCHLRIRVLGDSIQLRVTVRVTELLEVKFLFSF